MSLIKLLILVSENTMSSICCPHCLKEIKTPSNAAAWIVGLIATIFAGGFFMIVICLGAISAIGANANTEFSRVSAEVEAGEAQVEAINYQHEK